MKKKFKKQKDISLKYQEEVEKMRQSMEELQQTTA